MISFRVFKFNYKLFFIVLALSVVVTFSLFYYHSFSVAKTCSVEINGIGNEEDSVVVPIVMYHSVLKSKSGKYIVHPETLENDFRYIQSKGYTTITMTDLIDYVYNDIELPEKPIIISFDDGCYNNLSYAVPLLHKYNMKAVISIVGKFTETYSNSDEANPNYGYLRWKDINELMTDGCIEFQNHTYNLHSANGKRKGCRKLSYESLEQYTNVLTNDINTLQNAFEQNCNGYVPNTFTYPYGSVSEASVPIIKDLGLKASLSCASGVNYITKDPNCLYLLKRNNRIYGISTKKFFSKLLE